VQLYLVQHGKAKPKDEDPERTLTEEGRAEVEGVARFLAPSLSAQRAVIYHSGKARARQTAHALTAAFPSAALEEVGGLGPMDDPLIWAQRLAEGEGDVVLVGHLPHLGRLAGLLLAGSPEEQPVSFSNGGVVCLRRNAEGRWTLVWSVVPTLVP
jgi:phosphohistidine phosphatase